MLIGGGCSAESCSGGIRNSAEKGISRGANCQVFAPAVFEIHRAPLETGFVLLQRYSIHAEQSPPTPMWLLNSCCFLWCIFLSVMLMYRKTFELSINPPKSLYACSPGFITCRAKSNTTGSKTALREILL
jgi:hypothetical protein